MYGYYIEQYIGNVLILDTGLSLISLLERSYIKVTAKLRLHLMAQCLSTSLNSVRKWEKQPISSAATNERVHSSSHLYLRFAFCHSPIWYLLTLELIYLIFYIIHEINNLSLLSIYSMKSMRIFLTCCWMLINQHFLWENLALARQCYANL